MGNFIKDSSFIRYFNPPDDFSILHIGYDDFSVIKPAYIFRMQNIYTWHFLISGEGTLEIYGKKFHLTAGDMFYIPPDVKMRYYPKADNPWEYVWLSFKGEKTEEYVRLAGFTEGDPILRNGNFERIKRLLLKTIESFLNDGCGYFGLLSAFYDIMEICTINIQNNGIQAVKALIDESFAVPNFSVEGLCRDFGISHAQLLRLFKKEYGVTVIKYLIHKRIELACYLLKNSKLQVNEIAFSCGFSDEIHFMKTFKKQIGISALSYRKNTL